MSWLWSSSPVDELVDKATSESLLAGTDDLALNLEICDQIRSKQVSPKDAAKALKRRIGHKNPNVQLLALGLTDVCVKNGGQHFLLEVASREFVDNLVSILKSPVDCNVEVRNKILALMQTWGRLFRGKKGLGYVCDTYMVLQHEGYQFPPVDNDGAVALVETEAPPDWTDSDVCTRCRTTFTLTNRKHHCRACGSTFCGQCSNKTMVLPHLGITQEVRVCLGCWMKKKQGHNNVASQENYGLGGPAEVVPGMNKSTQPATATTTVTTNTETSNAGNDDEDLLRAIELSLKEVNSRPGYSGPSAKRQDPEPTAASEAETREEDDADLLAAIEASLRESNLHDRSASPQQDQHQSSCTAYTFTSQSEVSNAVSSNDLTETEKDNIEMFSSLVDKIQMTNGDVAGNREVQALYEQISKLQMKIALSLDEAAKRQRDAIQFNEKINQAVKMYDHLLQERLNSTYQRRMNANNYGHSGLPQQAGFNDSSPQSGHAYPHLAGVDSRYSPYAPEGPYNQQYQYQSSQPPSAAPFAMPSIPSGPGYATAPPASLSIQSYEAQAPPAPQASTQDLYYASAPNPASSIMSPPTVHHISQPPLPGYQNMMVAPSGLMETPYNIPQQQQYDAFPQTCTHAAPATPVAVVAPVDEKPLIEL
ncbi:Vacuolar protein-sorting-associated protein 27 [Mortierella polycephala]|uniref:Vacuolar protein sorting-associated protein 27 n=1 Tax=Mortierella polycephala TaxID=41804 RepID=A0A9P6Q8D7_9FUNG|nr:Vacuolar protein-sorting-associated protein 27 [Mortierella polycephala]